MHHMGKSVCLPSQPVLLLLNRYSGPGNLVELRRYAGAKAPRSRQGRTKVKEDFPREVTLSSVVFPAHGSGVGVTNSKGRDNVESQDKIEGRYKI